MAQLYEKAFTLPNTISSIPGSLSDILGYIENHLTNHPRCRFFISKAKWIMVEMMTNAVKHSGVDEIQVKIAFDENKLIIEKTDNGHPLKLPFLNAGGHLSWPLKNIPTEKVHVYGDEMHVLYSKIEDDGTATFFVDTKNVDAVSFEAENLSEHFGLLIITKSADEFTYSYDEKTKHNSFKCIIDTSIIE